MHDSGSLSTMSGGHSALGPGRAIVVLALLFGTAILTLAPGLTAAQTTPGGAGFTIRSLEDGSVRLEWQGGSQSGYRLTRTTAVGATILTVEGTATSLVDVVPAGVSVACYRLEALNPAGGTLASSDVLCAFPRIANGAGPRVISATLNQSNTAVITWSEVPGAAYVLVPLGTLRSQVLTGLTAVDPTRGVVTCYIVVAGGTTGTTVTIVGNSDIVCVVPGRSSGLPTPPGTPGTLTSLPTTPPIPSATLSATVTPTRTATGTVLATATTLLTSSPTASATSTVTRSPTASSTVTVTRTPITGPPPANDSFAAAATIAVPGAASGQNATATTESGEPQTSCTAGFQAFTVWHRFVAPQTTTITLTTEGSDFDTLLTVYTGSTLNNLSEVACSDDIAVGQLASLLSFAATAGQTYFIQIGGFNNVPGGNYTLQTLLPPANDNFAGEIALTVPSTTNGSNRAATLEPGEPSCPPLERSLWYRFTAGQNGSVTIRVNGSETLDVELGVYTGSTLATLVQVACFDSTSRGGTEQLAIPVTAGQTYHLQIGGFSGTAGDFVLDLIP